MDEILKKLLESDLLSEETKAEITAQWTTAVDKYLSEERAKVEVEVRSQLTEEFVKAREELAAKVDEKIESILTAEFDELKEDINKFRDLEVEYAEKLVEEKEKLAQQLAEQLAQLVDKLDAFLEVRIDEEMSELKESIEDVKKLEFGRRIFEAVEAEFKAFRKSDLNKVEQDLAEALDKLQDAESKIATIEQQRLAEARNTKMDELLAPLSGNAREQMKIILSNVATEKLDEAFKVYIGRIVKESVSDKKDATVTETDTEVTPIVEGQELVVEQATIVTGNEEEKTQVVEEVKPDEQLLRIKKLAGLSAR